MMASALRLRNGRSALRACSTPVFNVNGEFFALSKGPYRAETFAVAVERDYLVIEM